MRRAAVPGFGFIMLLAMLCFNGCGGGSSVGDAPGANTAGPSQQVVPAGGVIVTREEKGLRLRGSVQFLDASGMPMGNPPPRTVVVIGSSSIATIANPDGSFDVSGVPASYLTTLRVLAPGFMPFATVFPASSDPMVPSPGLPGETVRCAWDNNPNDNPAVPPMSFLPNAQGQGVLVACVPTGSTVVSFVSPGATEAKVNGATGETLPVNVSSGQQVDTLTIHEEPTPVPTPQPASPLPTGVQITVASNPTTGVSKVDVVRTCSLGFPWGVVVGADVGETFTVVGHLYKDPFEPLPSNAGGARITILDPANPDNRVVTQADAEGDFQANLPQGPPTGSPRELKIFAEWTDPATGLIYRCIFRLRQTQPPGNPHYYQPAS